MRIKISSVLTGLFGLALTVSFSMFIALLVLSLRSNALNELNDKFQAIMTLNEKIFLDIWDRNKSVTAALADDFMIIKAFVDLKSGFDSSNRKAIIDIYKTALQDRSSILMRDGVELYEFMHEAHHTQIRKYLGTSFFSDIILIALDGTVIYSYKKNDEFAKNINYSNAKTEKVKIITRLISLIGEGSKVVSALYLTKGTNNYIISLTSIMIKGKRNGYAVSITPFSHISDQLNDAGVLGKTGAIILANKRGKPLAWKGLKKSEVAKWTIPPELGVNENVYRDDAQKILINNKPFHIASKIIHSEEREYRIILHQEDSELFRTTTNLQYRMILIGILIVLSVLLIVVIMTKKISQPLATVTSALERVTTGNIGDESVTIKSSFQEIKKISSALVAFRESLVERQDLEKSLVNRSLEMEMLNEEMKYKNRELENYRDHLEDMVKSRTQIIEEQAGKLEEALKGQKELNDLQRSFVSMASHEFRTPLAIIDTVSQKLVRRADRMTPEKLNEHSLKIRKAVQRMTGLMESTLSAARMENGKIKVNITSCNIIEIVTDCCKNQQELSSDHDIQLKLDNAPETIMADPAAMTQVVTNLLSNAVKYSPNAPRIDVSLSKQGKMVLIEVRDYGLGIDQEELPKMFTRFFRAKTSTGIAGTGIGLNLCKMLVEEHSGQIRVASKKGEGSVFIVALPL